MSTEAITQFAEYGGYIGLLTGVLIIGSFALIGVLWKRLIDLDKKFELLNIEFRKAIDSVQEKRVNEAKSVSEQLSVLTDETNKAIGGLTAALDRQRETTLSVISKLGG